MDILVFKTAYKKYTYVEWRLQKLQRQVRRHRQRAVEAVGTANRAKRIRAFQRVHRQYIDAIPSKLSSTMEIGFFLFVVSL